MHVALIDCDTIVWVAAYLNKDKSDEEMFLGTDNFLKELLINVKADKYIGFLQGPEDMRRGMFPDYKANRPPTPGWLKERKPVIIDYLLSKWKFVYTDKGYEADDAIASVHHILLSRRDDTKFETDYIPIVCSPDKDLKQIPGWNYNTKTKGLIEITKDQATYNIGMQLLHGDTTDNIPNLRKGYGPATAAKALAEFGNMSPIGTAYIEFVAEYGVFTGSVKFAENVLKVVLRRDSDYKFELVDVPADIKLLYENRI